MFQSKSIGAAIEALEARQMMTVSILNPVADLAVGVNAAPTVIDLAGRYDVPNITGSVAKFDTVLGVINVEMEDTRTPLTVANFYQYVDALRYVNNIFHRSVEDFVIQGGGFSRPELDFDPPREVTTFPAVMNEPGISNLRGTLAMAKRDGLPNSATSQWFFNLGSNTNLDTTNGGFTVFGHVILGLDVMDAIAAVPTFRFDSPFGELPLRDFANGEGVEVNDYISMTITRADKSTITVTSSNAALVMPTLTGNNLSLAYAAEGEGGATVTVRITGADGSVADDAFNVSVGVRPTVASLNLSPAPPVGQGIPLLLTAEGVTSQANPVAKVQFFRDVNANGTLEPEVDSLLGEDLSADGGYTLSVNTAQFPLGVTTLFARGVDTTDVAGVAAVATTTIASAPRPTIASLAISPTGDLRLGTPIVLTANGIESLLNPLAKVQFFRDANNNGTLEPETDTLLSEDASADGGFTAMVDSTNLPVGTLRFFARGVDNVGIAGDPASATTTLFTGINIGIFTVSPDTTNRNSRVALAISGLDAGTLKFGRVEFFWDSNGNGVFDGIADRKVGQTSTLKNGRASVETSTKGLRVGDNIFFARVLATNGSYGAVRPATLVIENIAPTLKALKTSTALLSKPGESLELSITGGKDVDGRVVKVQYFRDSGTTPDGTLNPDTDTLLGEVNGSGNGMRLRLNTSAFPTGSNKFFARVFDNEGGISTAANALAFINAAPTIGGFVLAPTSGPRSSNYTLEANNVGDVDGGIRSVTFFWDIDNDNVITSRDKELGKARLIEGVWTLQIRGSLLNFGANHLAVRAEDNFKVLSGVSFGTLTLTQA